MSSSRRISFIGSGNVAWALAHAFDRAGHKIHQIISRHEANAKKLAKKFGAYSSSDLGMIYKEVDLIIIAAADNSIADIAAKLQNIHLPIAHTSGTIELDALSGVGEDYGVIYPLQSFSKETTIDFRELPFLIEGSNPSTYELLYGLAGGLSNNVSSLNSEQRRKLHLSAVMVNNFTNHLYHLASEYLGTENIPFELLLPLINQTSDKLKSQTPEQAQTGPARRGDSQTIEAHIDMLNQHPELQDVYKVLSKSILKKFNDD
jgi:predicted short-subunit dehydrogenase-like oxidoreductase (DUF2520 family)